MHVHHLNCATMCPPGQRLVNGIGSLLGRGRMICHCLLVETSDGLLLVDTGIGLEDIAAAARRLGRLMLAFGRPRLDPEESAARQVVKLGYSIADVRHVLPTHLDIDHAGGVGDFPGAKAHVHEPEHRAAAAPTGLRERHRYSNFARGAAWTLHRTGGERWFGFDCVRPLPSVSPEVLLVPLPGHSPGHCAIAVKAGDRWLLHCGDAYFNHRELDLVRPSCPPGLALFQRIIQVNGAARLESQARLRALARDHGSEVEIFCAHDPIELDRHASAVTRAT